MTLKTAHAIVRYAFKNDMRSGKIDEGRVVQTGPLLRRMEANRDRFDMPCRLYYRDYLPPYKVFSFCDFSIGPDYPEEFPKHKTYEIAGYVTLRLSDAYYVVQLQNNPDEPPAAAAIAAFKNAYVLARRHAVNMNQLARCADVSTSRIKKWATGRIGLSDEVVDRMYQVLRVL